MINAKTAFIGFFAVLFLALGGWMMAQRTQQDDHVITPAGVQSLIGSTTPVLLLDVRTPEEFTGSSGHVAGSILIPVQELEKRLGELEPYRDRRIVAICRSGNRSGHATNYLRQHGFDAVNMVGGMIRWNSEERPTSRDPIP